MQLKLNLNIGESFMTNESDDPTHEVARLLRDLASRIDGHPHFSSGHSQPIWDRNGDECGYFWIESAKEVTNG
jgi:hypothetical protein